MKLWGTQTFKLVLEAPNSPLPFNNSMQVPKKLPGDELMSINTMQRKLEKNSKSSDTSWGNNLV